MTVDLIICRTCKKELTNEDFYWRDKSTKQRLSTPDCKTCTKKRQKEKNDLLKKRTIEEAVTKIEKRCNQCKQILKVKEFGIALTNPDGLKTICKPCESKRSMAWGNSTPERRERKLARNKSWFRNNREQHYVTAKKWKENNPEKVKEVQKKSTKKYLASEKGKEQLAKTRRIRTESGKGAAYKRARDAQKRNATPPWQDLEALFPIYEEAAILENINGLEYEVDHIDPLKNKLVCGLHVPENLQAIPKSNNRAKHNKFIPYRIDLNEEIWELKGEVWIKKKS